MFRLGIVAVVSFERGKILVLAPANQHRPFNIQSADPFPVGQTCIVCVC